MKYKYLKVAGDFVWGKNTISKKDLIQADLVIDTEDNTVYIRRESNEWQEIKGDS